MGNTEKGKKGFQSSPENEQKNKRINVYLTSDELEAFKQYCNDKNTTQSNVLRSFVLGCIGTGSGEATES